MNNIDATPALLPAALHLALDLLAAIHGDVRNRERQAIDALVAWLDAVGSPIAATIRDVVASLEPHRSIRVNDLLRVFSGGYREDSHWTALDARAILTRACVIFVLKAIADHERKDREVCLFPLQVFGALSEQGEVPWLLLAPIVRDLLHRMRTERKETFAKIADDILVWALYHRRLDDLLDEVGCVSKRADDEELRAHASLVTQVAGTPDLHR